MDSPTFGRVGRIRLRCKRRTLSRRHAPTRWGGAPSPTVPRRVGIGIGPLSPARNENHSDLVPGSGPTRPNWEPSNAGLNMRRGPLRLRATIRTAASRLRFLLQWVDTASSVPQAADVRAVIQRLPAAKSVAGPPRRIGRSVYGVVVSPQSNPGLGRPTLGGTTLCPPQVVAARQSGDARHPALGCFAECPQSDEAA